MKQVNDLDIPDHFVLPDGNVARGQLLFKKHCAQCHTIRRDNRNKYGALIGPSLYGVMGRTAAQNQRTGWARYSPALEASGILWTDRNMMAFLKNPRAFADGVINMNFRGLDSFADRVDIVHYLKRAGHENWMVQEGRPHSQKGWWRRDKEPSPSVWQRVNVFVSETAAAVLGRPGLAPETAGGAAAEAAEDDPERRKWRQVQRVVDGVRPASMQRSFNWPPPEDIAAGPVKKGSLASPVPAADLSSTLVACEELPPCPPGGTRAPSGLTVYDDFGGPAAAAVLQAAPRAAQAA
mmetsp:Transcript_55049/g.144796  ORF Transcript_55049/g.144796 Transcript_55049/m.144796 type:complete len:294 (+) Transcript_55049:89-970(+)